MEHVVWLLAFSLMRSRGVYLHGYNCSSDVKPSNKPPARYSQYVPLLTAWVAQHSGE